MISGDSPVYGVEQKNYLKEDVYQTGSTSHQFALFVQLWFGHNGDRKLWDGQLPVIKPLHNPTASYMWEGASSNVLSLFMGCSLLFFFHGRR